jgi:hypothetical protein
MKDLLKIASLLDESGHYKLSDKLYKIAQFGILAPPNPNKRKKLIDIKPPETKDPRSYMNTSNNYVPPVEYYSGVDANKYKEFGGYVADYLRQNNFNPEQTYTMDSDQYYGNSNSLKDITKLRNMIVPTNFRNQLKRFHAGDTEMNSSNPTSFANSLWEFARKNKMSNSLTDAFDAYADSGATYNGQKINSIPQLKELYMYIKSKPRSFSETEVAELLKEAFNNI